MFLFQEIKTKESNFFEILGKSKEGALPQKFKLIIEEYKKLDLSDKNAVKKFEAKLDSFGKEIIKLYDLANVAHPDWDGRAEALAFCQVGVAWLRGAYNKIGDSSYNELFDRIGKNIDKNYAKLPGFADAQTDYRSLYLGEDTAPKTKDRIEKTVSSVGFAQMKTDTYGMFDHLNFNVVDGKVKNGMNLEDYKEELLAFYASAKESGNAEELAFCYQAFKWLNTTDLGSKSCSNQIAEIDKMNASKSSEFVNKSGYYSKYFEVLARAVVGGTEDGTNVLWYHLNESATEKLALYLQQISENGKMLKRGLFSFYTSENANIFVDQVLKKFGGASFDYEIRNEGGKWKVSFMGKEDTSKTADPLRNSPGEFFSTRDMTIESDESERNRTRTNETITNVVKGKDIQTGEKAALDFSKEKGEVLSATNQEIASIWAHTPMFHAHHYKPIKNPEKVTEWIMLYLQGRLGEASPKGQDEREILNSIESLGDSFKKMLSDLAVRDGFDANKTSLVEFLKTDAGRKFWEGLVQSVKDGTFVNVTGATSEYIGSPSDAIKQLDLVAVGRSKLTMLFLNAMARYTNGELAKGPNFNGEQLKEIDENSVSLVPTVVLLVDPGNTDVLIQKALDYYKRGGNRSAEDIAFVQKKLEEFYSPQTIAQNQHNFLAAIEDLSHTSSEAKAIWDRWNRKGYVKQDSETGLYRFNSKHIGAINSEISFNNRVKQPDQTFEKALYVCSTMYPLGGEFMDARYSAYNLLRNVSLTLNVDKTEVKDNQVKVTVSVQKQFENKNGKLEDKPFVGHLDQYLFAEDGTRIEGKETNRYEKDGKTYIELTYTVAPGMKCTFVGNAFDEINSGMVKKGVVTQEKVRYTLDPHVTAGIDNIVPGEESTITINAYGDVGKTDDKNKVIAKIPLDILTILVGRGPTGDIKYLFAPGKDEDVYVKEVLVQDFSGHTVPVEAPLIYQGKEVYGKDKLLSLANKGAVAIMFNDISGGEVWLTLDGKTQLRGAELDELKKKGKVDGSVLYLTSKEVKTTKRDAQITSNMPTPIDTKLNGTTRMMMSAIENMTIPNVLLLPPGDVTIGGVEYSHDKLVKLAEQNIVAVVEGNKIYGLDGRVIGDLEPIKKLADTPVDDQKTKQDQSYHKLPEYNGIFAYLPNFSDYAGIFAYLPRPNYFEAGMDEYTEKITYFVPRKVKDVDVIVFSRQGKGEFDYNEEKFKKTYK